MRSDPTVHEIYAKSSTGRFLVAKKTGEEELYMQIGRKDASLTDAERECSRRIMSYRSLMTRGGKIN
jgi:hypothetical protein